MTTNAAASKSDDDYKRQPYLTIEDVADILRRTVNGVRKMRAMGHLPPARRTGNRLLWNSVKFFNWIEQQEEPDDFDPGPAPRRLGSRDGRPRRHLKLPIGQGVRCLSQRRRPGAGHDHDTSWGGLHHGLRSLPRRRSPTKVLLARSCRTCCRTCPTSRAHDRRSCRPGPTWIIRWWVDPLTPYSGTILRRIRTGSHHPWLPVSAFQSVEILLVRN